MLAPLYAVAEEVPTSFSASAVASEVSLSDCQTCATCSPCNVSRPQDQVWLISTRGLPCGAGQEETPDWQVSLRQEQSWGKSTTDNVFAANGEIRTVIYVHGNRVDSNYAVEGGLRVYRHLVCCADERPIRFIIWSWCSDKLQRRRPVRDARVKAEYANDEAVVFARFLNKFTPDDHVGLVGFSYGGRIVASGLHLMGGGSWQGQRLPKVNGPAQFKTVLWAAAFDNHALLPGCANGCAIEACPQWLNMYNRCDDALKYYSRLEKCDKEAIGFTGVAGKATILARGIDFRECTTQSLVGTAHESRVYPESPAIIRDTRAVVLP